MRFLGSRQAAEWATAQGVEVDARGLPAQIPPGFENVQFLLPQTPGQVAWLCRFISECLSPREMCLLWITETDVSPSSENWHLYYRVRQSYQDHQLLYEAPGHLFLDYEEPDFITFLQIGLLAGWDMHLIPRLAYGVADTARAFVSHDEWIVLLHRDKSVVQEWRKTLDHAHLRTRAAGAA